jgi:hypothetical protein
MLGVVSQIPKMFRRTCPRSGCEIRVRVVRVSLRVRVRV